MHTISVQEISSKLPIPSPIIDSLLVNSLFITTSPAEDNTPLFITTPPAEDNTEYTIADAVVIAPFMVFLVVMFSAALFISFLSNILSTRRKIKYKNSRPFDNLVNDGDLHRNVVTSGARSRDDEPGYVLVG